MKPVLLGVIGCGNVLGAYRLSIDQLRLTGDAEVTVVCGRENQRPNAAKMLGSARFATDEREVLFSPEVDVVILLTSMAQHAPLAIKALNAGKHVLVEKPFATTLDDADEVLGAAARNERLLVCAPFTVLSPTFQTMARRIRDGSIGKPCLARARYGWSGPWWSEWFYKPGGGCLSDLAVYNLTSLTGLLGPARRVTAMSGVAIPEREVNGTKLAVEAEDNAQVLLDFGEGAFGVVTSGFTMQQYRSPAIEIYGSTGVIQMLGDDWDPDGYELWQNKVGAWQLFKETDPDWHWTAGLPLLVESLQRGSIEPLLRPEHARHVLEILVKARQSAKEGRTLPIESTFEPLKLAATEAQEAAHTIHDRSRSHAT